MRKFISLISAAAVLASVAVVPITASAAVGDELMSQNFEETTWGEGSRHDAKINVTYDNAENAATTLDEALKTNGGAAAATVTPPSVVSEKSMYMATAKGQDPGACYTISPAIKTSATGVYLIKFDGLFVSGNYDAKAADEMQQKPYSFGIGAAANGQETVRIKVVDDDMYLETGTGLVDTGIDLTNAGTWFNLEFKVDTNTKKYNAKITPYSGDELDTQSTVSFNSLPFFYDTTSLATLNVKAERNGSLKGAVYCGVDNFVVTEATADQYADVTINFIDGGGNPIKDAITDSGLVGEEYTVADLYKANIAYADDETKYYEYVSGGDEAITVAESDNKFDLVFELKDKVNYTVKAKSGEKELADIASGYVIPGEKVTAYGTYGMIVDGAFYAAENTKVTFEPTVGEPEAVIEYTELTAAEGDRFDFDENAASWTLNNEHMTSEITSVDGHDTNAVKFTSKDSGESKIGTALMDLSAYADYKTIYLNYESFISGGRFTLSIFDKSISGYSDAGLFSIGIKDGRGYRINGTENKAGEGAWTNTSVKVDLDGGKLYYQVFESKTGKLLASGTNNITAESVKALGLISWSDSSAAVDNIDVIATDKDIPDAEYTFEDEENPFELDNSERATMEIVEADGTIVQNGHALKFKADDRAGTSVPETATFDYSEIAAGASKVKIQFDSYVPETNAMIINMAANGESWLRQGYGNGYYRINGESGSAYTSATGAWVKTVINIDLDTGEVVYTLYNASGAQLYSGKNTVDAHAAGKLRLEVTASDAAVYIDNLSIKATAPEAAELSDDLFTIDDHSSTAVVGGAEAPVEYDGDVIKFTADDRTGSSVPATASYDISGITEGKGYIVISYDSYVKDHSVIIGADETFRQGYGNGYYRINGESGSKYTGANGAWVHTDLIIDLNAHKQSYTLSWTEDGEAKTYSGSDSISAKAVNAIVIKAASAEAEAYISNIHVTALGEYIPDVWTKYVKTADGKITMTENVNPAEVTAGAGETVYIWNASMVPYSTPLVGAVE